MKRMSILFLITGLITGGAEMQVYRIVTQLDSKRYRPIVVSLEPGPIGDMLNKAGILVYSLGMRKGILHIFSNLSGPWRLYQILRKEQPYILINLMFHASIFGRIIGHLAKVPVISSSIRGSNLGSRWRELVMKYTSVFDDVTTTNSVIVGEQMIQRGVMPRYNIRVIPNGIDVKAFHRSSKVRKVIRHKLDIPNSTFVWLAIGRLEPAKDYSNLLQAFAQVGQKMQTHLLIIGEGYLKEKLQALAQSLNIETNLQFLGLRQEIPELLAAADAFVLASAWEGLPNVVMEAMAAQKPVVTTEVGGIPELVINGETGFIVPTRNPKALADAMIRLMKLPEDERKKMGLAGCKLMKERYSLKRIVQQWEAFFKELLHGKDLF